MPAAPNLRKARLSAYRELILGAAEKVFADFGFEGTRVSAVAEEAGVSVGTLYGVFPGKAELFNEVLTHRLPAILAAAHDAASGARGPVESLVLGMDAYVGFMLDHPDFLRIHLREHAWGLGPERGAPEQLAAWRGGLEFYARVLASAMDAGHVVRCDPNLLARSISAIQQVHLAHWVDGGMNEDPALLRARLVGLFRAYFCTADAPETPVPGPRSHDSAAAASKAGSSTGSGSGGEAG